MKMNDCVIDTHNGYPVIAKILLHPERGPTILTGPTDESERTVLAALLMMTELLRERIYRRTSVIGLGVEKVSLDGTTLT